MKILMLADNFGTGGGAGTIARLQAEELSKNHELTVLTASAPTALSQARYELVAYNLQYDLKWRNFRGVKNKAATRILREYLEKFSFDLAITHNIHTFWSYASLSLLKLFGIKTITVLHDVSIFTNYSKLCNIKYKKENNKTTFYYWYPWYRFLQEHYYAYFNPLRKMLIRRYLASATHRIAVSYALADALKQNDIRVDAVIHNGVPKTVTEPPRDVTVGYGETILFIGKTITQKGVLEIVDYLVYLKAKHALTPALEIAGSQGPGFKKMMDKARALGVAGQIKLHGWLESDAYRRVLSRCGMVIVPSICFDSLPTVILEAYQYKKPVVATMYGGSSEIVEHGRTGFIADPKNVAEFAGFIQLLLENKNKAKYMGTAGYEIIRKQFSLEQQTKKMLELTE